MDAKSFNAGNNTLGGGGYLPLLASFIFNGLSGSIVPSSGGVNPNFTRATIATITDQDLVVRQVLSGEARFGGFRRVQNLLVSTGLNGGPSPPTGWTRSSAGGTETSAASAYFGGHSAITFGIANQREIISLTVNLVAGHSYRATVFCEGITGASTFVNQSLEVIAGTATITGSVSFASSIMLAGRRYAKDVFNCTVSGTATFRLGLGVSAVETGTGTITLSAPMLEDVTGQSNQNPAEYVSVGVLSAPYQGANVDGVQYFNTLNGNTVTNNVVTEATGPNINGNSNFGALPGASGAYFSTPDSAAASITGDIDIRVKANLNNWASGSTQILLAKDIAGQFSYDMYVSTTGNLVLRISLDGGTGAGLKAYSSTAIIPATNFVTLWVRATRSAATGAGTFYTSQDGVTWTQLGAVVANTSGAIFDGTDILEIGANTTGTTNLLSGKIYRAQIYNGIAGTLAVDFNPNSWTSGATWVSATGETWTINGGAAIVPVSLGGYLPEPAATNLQLWSSDHTNATYTKTDTTPTITGTDPSGTSLANLNTEGVAGTATVQSAAMAITANTSNTFSIYAKRGNTDWVCLQLINGAVTSGVRAWFNLNTGAKGSTTTIGTGSGATSEITPLGNSWYRISLAGVVDAASVTAITFIQTASADASLVRVNNGTYQTWGRQFNTGRQIGLINSYIPTTTVAVTRNADVLTYATTGWLNANAGSLYGEFFNPTLSGPYVIASLNNGGGNDRINIYANTITTAGQDVLIGGATQSSLSAVALTGGAIAKIITMYQVNDFAGYANNTTLGTDAAGNLPTVTALNIGNVVGSNYLGHYIRTVAYWRSRLPNAIAQAKTV